MSSAVDCKRPGCQRRTRDPSARCFDHRGPEPARSGGAGGAGAPPPPPPAPDLNEPEAPEAIDLGVTWSEVDFSAVAPVGTKVALWRHRRSLAEFAYDAAALEGNPFTYPEVQTLLEGITVGGRRTADADQVSALGASLKLLCDTVEAGVFELDKTVHDGLHAVVAVHDALEVGHFRGEGPIITNVSVALGEGKNFAPPPTVRGGENLIVRQKRARELAEEAEPMTGAILYGLISAREQYYYDGNKRTARLMMNGALITAGYDAISVPADARQAYNEAMSRFYPSGDATEMLTFYRDLALAGAARAG